MPTNIDSTAADIHANDGDVKPAAAAAADVAVNSDAAAVPLPPGMGAEAKVPWHADGASDKDAEIINTLMPPHTLPPMTAAAGGVRFPTAVFKSAPSGGTDTLVKAAVAAAASQMHQVKRGRGRPPGSINKNTGGSSSSSSSSSSFRRMNDSEFVRAMTAEFKRRGYTIAIQLRSDKVGQAVNNTSSSVKKVGDESEKKAGVLTVQEIGMAEEAVPPPLPEDEGEEPDDSKPPAKKAKVADTTKTKSKKQQQQNLLPTFSFYPSTVTISQKNIDTWNAMYNKLKVYHDTHNGALPFLNQQPPQAKQAPEQQQKEGQEQQAGAQEPPETSKPTKNASDKEHNALAKWTKSQITLWKRMKKDSKHNLSLDRIIKLHSVNLDRGANQIIPIGDKGILDVLGGGGNGEEGVIMVATGKNAQKWQEKYDELRKYKELHGDTNVPRSYNDALSKWCSTQRMRCKAVLNGETNTSVTRTQFQALQNIGLDMSVKRKQYDRSIIDRKWEERFQELLEYKEKFGDCDVAIRKGFEEYKQLANWAGLMRRKYKCKQTGTKAGRTTGITDDQIKKLASVGFSFSLQDDFETRFKHLLEFKKEYGHTKVPVFYTGYSNLGRWAKRMRDGIRNNEPWMDDLRKERLLGIDFDIAARHVFGHKTQKRSKMIDDDEEAADMDHHQPVGETQAEAAATTMARMDNNDYGRTMLPQFGSPQFYYHGYPPSQP